MADRAVPQDLIERRVAAIDEEIADLEKKLEELRLRRAVLAELLEETVPVDIREEADENPTLTTRIIRTIAEHPGVPSRVIARRVSEAQPTTQVKTVQTIIGQLLRKPNPPIVRDEEQGLYPAPELRPAIASDEFEDFPGSLQDEDDNLPF